MEYQIVSDYVLPGVLALIMVGMGLSLTFDDFKRIVKNPKELILGLFLQLILLPVIAVIIAYTFNLKPEYQVGLIIIAACPGGATSNLITHILRGRLALSVSLTTFNSLITIISVPIVVNIGLKLFMGETSALQMPIGRTIISIFLITLVPVLLGILLRRRNKSLAIRLNKPLKIIMPLLLGVVYFIAILGERHGNSTELWRTFATIFPATLVLNITGMILGYFTGFLFRIGRASRLTLAIEVGIQNSALGITLASSSLFLHNYQMALPAVIYGMFTFFNALLIGYILRKFF